MHKNVKDSAPMKAGILDMYKYAGAKYIFVLVVAILNAIIGGILFPLKFLVIRDIFGQMKVDQTNDGYTDHIRDQSYWFIVLSVGAGITSYLFTLCFSLVGQKISYELRWRYMKSILTKDCNWYEENDVKSLPFRVNSNLAEVENATGRTIAFICYAITIYISSLVLCLICGFTLGACMLIIIPFSLICFGVQMYINEKDFTESESNYHACGANAEQALYAIKVVRAFNQTTSEYSVYESHLNKASQSMNKKACLYGIGCGLVESLMSLPSVYSILISGFFITGEVNNWIVDRPYNTGDTGCIYWLIQAATYFFGISLISFQSLNRGLICAGSIFRTIDSQPEINLDQENSQRIDSIKDDIVFQNVVFKYKDRQQNAVDDISLTFKKGKVTALVGPSGSGKTTIAKLLERFYDPQNGSILVNGTELRNINLRDYRRRVGYVGQEPCLFNESIRNNLLNANPQVTDQDITECLKAAMAYDFVLKLPDGIESNVGALGNKLSGGQKQRIAIARALISKPDLLILDEATSALDNRNEKYVQSAIENIRKITDISTVVIAHRLTTIKDADLIILIDSGKIIEQGTHQSLIEQGKHYKTLYNAQNVSLNVRSNEVYQTDYKGEDIEKIENIEHNELLTDESFIENSTSDCSQNEFSSFEIFVKLLFYSKPYAFIVIAIIGASLVATSLVIFQIPCMKLSIYFSKDSNSDIRNDMAEYIPIMFGIGIFGLISQIITRFCLYWLTSSMTMSIRKDTYKSILEKPLQSFDDKHYSVGNLTGILATETKDLNGASIELYILLYQGIVSIIASLVVCFIYSWNIGLTIAGFLPGMTIAACIIMKYQMIKPKSKQNIHNIERTIVSDCIANYSTIASLANEDAIVNRYFKNMSEEGIEKAVNFWKANRIGLLYAFSQFLSTIYFFPTYFIVANNIDDNKSLLDSFTAQAIGVLGAFYFSIILLNAPDMSRGRQSANTILNIVQEASEGSQDSPVVDGDYDLVKEDMGDIEFRHVWFKYPTSCKNWVLKDFCLTINKATSVGLVGESGCGKSTISQLLLRFYDCQRGEILIGGIPIQKFTLRSLRNAFGFIQQEPLIFDRSILDNILYGKSHATADEVSKAAQISNSAEFIDKIELDCEDCEKVETVSNSDLRYTNLGEGYKMKCGPRGNKLSGGQKQRIAIARAVIRQPAFLILDEATSALDEASQRAVQNSINNIMKTTTSLVIAHRLSTLSNCDKIAVICDGRVIEEGDFYKLMSSKSILSSLSANH